MTQKQKIELYGDTVCSSRKVLESVFYLTDGVGRKIIVDKYWIMLRVISAVLT